MKNFQLNKIEVKKTKIVITSEITLTNDCDLKKEFSKALLLQVLAGSSPNNLNMVDAEFKGKEQSDILEQYRKEFDTLFSDFLSDYKINAKVKDIKTN